MKKDIIAGLLVIICLYGCSKANADNESKEVKTEVNAKKSDIEALLKKNEANAKQASIISESADKAMESKIEATAKQISVLKETINQLRDDNKVLQEQFHDNGTTFTLDPIAIDSTK